MSADLVAVRVLEADVEDLRAAPCTWARPTSAAASYCPALDQLLELAAAEDVGALADEHRPLVAR